MRTPFGYDIAPALKGAPTKRDWVSAWIKPVEAGATHFRDEGIPFARIGFSCILGDVVG